MPANKTATRSYLPPSISESNRLSPATVSRSAESSTAPTRLLSVSSAGDDHVTLRKILSGMPWDLTPTATCKDAIARLGWDRIAIVLCECNLPDGTWKDILNRLADSGQPPLLIVTSKLANESLWAEVLNLGGYDVLAKPFIDKEVRHVLDSAWARASNPAQRVHVVGAA